MDGFHLSPLFLSQDLLKKPFPDSQILQWALGGRKWVLNREESTDPECVRMQAWECEGRSGSLQYDMTKHFCLEVKDAGR